MTEGDGPTTVPRVTLVISALVVGGAERVLTSLANGWVEIGRPVSIVTLDGPDQPPFFPVDSRVQVYRLGLARASIDRLDAIVNNVRRLVGLRRAIAGTRPDVVVSFMDRTNVLALLASMGAGWPVIVSDRTAADPNSGYIWRALRLLTYRRASWVVVQTQGSARTMPKHLRRRTVSIPNPVLADSVAEATAKARSDAAGHASDPNLVVAVGRLVPQKGFDLLISAFASVVRRAPAARLEIWGSGSEEAKLRDLVASHGLEASITLAGETRDPATAIRRAGLFVLSSRVEGFPNVLLEAMALGRAVIAVDCTFGPAEIVRDGIDGRLVPSGDIEALADAIFGLITMPQDAAALGSRAIEVRDRFAFQDILARWSTLVDGAKNRARR